MTEHYIIRYSHFLVLEVEVLFVGVDASVVVERLVVERLVVERLVVERLMMDELCRRPDGVEVDPL